MRYNISISSLFDDFFKYQIDIEDIAAWCKKKRLNSYQNVMLFLMAHFLQSGVAEKDLEHGIMWEYIKALSFHICRLNGILH